MVIKLIIVIFCLVATALGTPATFGYNVEYGLASPAAPTVHVFPSLPAIHVSYAALKADPQPEETPKKTVDPAYVAAFDTHKLFLEKQHVKPPYYYSFGYEVFNWKTGITQSHYESRYGDVAVGTYIARAADGNRSIVDYTVDTPRGFYGVLRKDFLAQRTAFGYARLGGPLAYASHPPPEEYASRTTVLADPGSIANPLVESAYRAHKIGIEYLDLSAPFNLSWGYDMTDSQTGIRRSQYETYNGDLGEGSYTQIEADGTKSSIDYSISPKGFAVTSPQTFSLKANPLVQAHALGYTSYFHPF